MALPEKMTSLQQKFFYAGLGVLAVAGVWAVWRANPCTELRRSFESDWRAGLVRDARNTLLKAHSTGCSWPVPVARETGIDV